MIKKTVFSVIMAGIFLLGLAVPVGAADAPVSQSHHPAEPALNNSSPGRYIVMFNDWVEPVSASAELGRQHGLALGHVYKYAIKGFSCYAPAGRLAALEADPRVKLVEPDLLAHTTEQDLPTGVDRIEADLNGTANINGENDPIDVDIAILDTGIDINHPDLNVVGGRHFYSFLGVIQYEDSYYDDDNGHGTHVAGIAAALDNDDGVVGVAPGARLWAVKVLDSGGSGYLSDIAAGVDYVTEHANEIEVANMSLSWTGNSVALRSAISESVSQGVVYFVAAGNDSTDIYGRDGRPYTNDDIQPASYVEVATISAMADYDGQPGGVGGSTGYGNDDSFASFSNFSGYNYVSNYVNSPGLGIDLIMPGVYIKSTYNNGASAIMSGTSMASPHAAGLAALYIAENGRANSMLQTANIRQALVDAGMPQSDAQNGLIVLDDPDGYQEPIGWAGQSGTPGNNPPVANDDSAIVEEDSTVNIINVLTNDSDADGDTLNVGSVTEPEHGTALNNGDGTVTYTPNDNYFGTDSFDYSISDGNGGTDTAIVNITINPVNDTPVANDDNAITQENTAVTISVLANDSDADGDILNVVSVTDPAHGTVVNNGDGTVTYTPILGYTGTDTFAYTVDDGNGDIDTAIVNITINPVNDAPIANDDDAITQEDISVIISVLTNDSDADGDTLNVASVTDPAHGTADFTDTTVTYTPNTDYFGPDSFSYTISDGNGGTDTAMVNITINPVNDAPVADAQSVTTSQDAPMSITLTGSDVDGDTLTFSIYSGPSHGSLSGSAPNLIYTPAPGFIGEDAFTFEVDDGNGGTDSAVVDITVEAEPVLPTIHVGDLDGTVTFLGKSGNWTASVTITVHDEDCNPVSGATIQGEWGDGTIVSGITTSDGTVTFSTDAIKKKENSVIFTVTGITSDLTYESSYNHDPDEDSNGTIITVNK